MLFFKKRSSIKQKIIGYFIGIMLGVTTLILINIVLRTQNQLLISQQNKAKNITFNLAVACADPMMVGEWDRLNQLLQEAKKADPDVQYAILLWTDGRCVATTEPELKDRFLNKTDFEKQALILKEGIQIAKNPERSKDIFEVFSPVISAGTRLGVLRVGYTTKFITAQIRGIVYISVLIAIFAVIVGAIVYYIIIQKGIVSPLGSMMKLAQEIATGDLRQKEIKIETKDEIEDLADTLTRMSKNLRDMVFKVRATADRVAGSAEQMSSSSQQVNASTQQVSESIQQISKGTAVQSERVFQTSEIMKKASISLKKVLENAQITNTGVSEASRRAELGRKAAEDTVEKISHLTETVLNTAKVIQSLGQSSQQIGEITETITKIADQTNLLALNAAIEAARAGEAGRGFAVVAEEVRKLAEGAGEAVSKIGGLIRSIQNETNRAVGSVEASAQEAQEGKEAINQIAINLNEINKAVQEASLLTKQISELIQEQVKGTEQVVLAVNEVADIAQQSASTAQEVSSSVEEQTASMEEMSASAQELSRLALELKEMMNQFKLD